MMKADILCVKVILMVYIILGISPRVQAQEICTDSVVHNIILSPTALAVSTGMITGGIILNAAGKGTVKRNFQDYVQKPFPGFHTNLDDYLQWAPAMEIGMANLAGIKAAHRPLNQAVLYSVSVLANAAIVQGLKELTGVTRPNGGDHSFPSGHTSNAFVNATVLYLEYHDSNTLLAWSGYLFATTTGALRVMNNAHWVSDVLAGAGTGILITHLVYSLNDTFMHSKYKNGTGKDISFVPVLLPGYSAFSITCNF